VGNKVGVNWKVSDGSVTCKNIATAALYRYTPWIGDADFQGNKSPFGNFLFYKVWTGLFGAIVFETTPQSAPAGKWMIIAPPDNWRSPIQINDDDLEKFEKLANLLNLKINKNEKQFKLYLGLPIQAIPESKPEAKLLKYPSGEEFPIIEGSPWNAPGSAYWASHPDVASPLIKLTTESTKKKLSDHFILEEFRCHDSSYDLIRISPKLIGKLEEIRSKCGNKPINILSAHRPYPYNADINGAEKNSYHIDGVAADIYVDGLSVASLTSIADTIIGNEGGVGAYYNDGFVHVDVRGTKSRW
jgi:hypothetical protein